MISLTMSLKQSTSSVKNEVLNELISTTEKSVARGEIMEKYFQRKVVLSPSRNLELLLGKAQAEIKEQKELLSFLLEQIDKKGESAKI